MKIVHYKSKGPILIGSKFAKKKNNKSCQFRHFSSFFKILDASPITMPSFSINESQRKMSNGNLNFCSQNQIEIENDEELNLLQPTKVKQFKLKPNFYFKLKKFDLKMLVIFNYQKSNYFFNVFELKLLRARKMCHCHFILNFVGKNNP